MKIIQINAWGGRLDNTLIDFLAKEKPDIFCGQELISYSVGDSIAFAPAELLQEKMNLKNNIFAPIASFNYMSGKAVFGNAIMTSYEVVKSTIEFTNLKFVENFNFEKHDYNIRNFVHTILNINGKPLNVITHHGYHVPHNKEGNSETLRQMKHIAKYLSNLGDPIIFTGDLNLMPSSESLLPINSLLRNLSVEYKLTTTRNVLTNKTEVCDYIFVSKDITVNNFKLCKELVSDHQALTLDFEI